MTELERVSHIVEHFGEYSREKHPWTTNVDIEYIDELCDIARKALERNERLESLHHENEKDRLENEMGYVATTKRLQRRLDTAEGLINEIRPRPSNCHEYDDTCWACRARKWLEDKQDG